MGDDVAPTPALRERLPPPTAFARRSCTRAEILPGAPDTLSDELLASDAIAVTAAFEGGNIGKVEQGGPAPRQPASPAA